MNRRPLSASLPVFPWDTLADVTALAKSHPDGIVDLSVGTPVDPVAPLIRDALAAASAAPGYPTTAGTPKLRQSAVAALERRYGVTGVNEAAVLPVIGTKELIAWLPTLLGFLSDIKAGRRPVRAPVYSHLTYDIVPNEWIEIDRPDILIVEGVNVLQTGRLPRDGKAVPVVSDFFDFSVYIDAEEPVLRDWYVRRFLTLRDTAFLDPRSYFHRYSLLSDDEAAATALAIWERTNRANLEDNILPTRPRATLILKKGADHVVETVALRRL